MQTLRVHVHASTRTHTHTRNHDWCVVPVYCHLILHAYTKTHTCLRLRQYTQIREHEALLTCDTDGPVEMTATVSSDIGFHGKQTQTGTQSYKLASRMSQIEDICKINTCTRAQHTETPASTFEDGHRWESSTRTFSVGQNARSWLHGWLHQSIETLRVRTGQLEEQHHHRLHTHSHTHWLTERSLNIL